MLEIRPQRVLRKHQREALLNGIFEILYLRVLLRIVRKLLAQPIKVDGGDVGQRAGFVAGQVARGDQFRAGIDDARHDHGGDQITVAVSFAGLQRFQCTVSQAAEHCGDMTIGFGAQDVEGMLQVF